MGLQFTTNSVAVALILGNRLWMSKRVNTQNFPGLWQFAGGKVEPGEPVLKAAIREVKEETGLDIDPSRLRFLNAIFNDPSTKVCYVYFVELYVTEVPQKTEDVMTKWQLFTYRLASKLNLMPGLPAMMIKLRYLYENEPQKLPSNPNP